MENPYAWRQVIREKGAVFGEVVWEDVCGTYAYLSIQTTSPKTGPLSQIIRTLVIQIFANL